MLFFVTFFPLFLPDHPQNSTILWMMLHVTALSATYQLLLVWIGNAASIKLSTIPNARKIAQRVAGLLLIGFGVKLAESVI
jgi:threonine/homoserine/homoserine lactone efflux protein